MSETIATPLSEEQVVRVAALTGARELLKGTFGSAPDPDDLMDLADYIIGGGDEEDFDPDEGIDYPGWYDESLELLEPARFRITQAGSHGFAVGTIVSPTHGRLWPDTGQTLMTTRHDDTETITDFDWEYGVTTWVHPHEMVEVSGPVSDYLANDDIEGPVFALDAEGLDALPAGSVILEHADSGAKWTGVKLSDGRFLSLYAKVLYGDDTHWQSVELMRTGDHRFEVVHFGSEG